MHEPVTVGDIVAYYVRARGVRGPHDGRVYWRARQGKRTVWVGWATSRECAIELAALLQSGTVRPRVADIRTVRDLLEYWVGTEVDEDPERAESTIYAIRGARNHPSRKGLGGATGRLCRDLGDVSVDRLTLDVLTDWRRRRQSRKGGAPHTLRAELGYLAAAWAWGRGIGATPDAPLPVLEIPKRNSRPRHTPSTNDVAMVARWMRDNAPPWAMALLLLQAATGARIGEVAGVRWCDIDGAKRTVRVDGKTGPRTIHRVRADVLAAVHRLRGNETEAWYVARRRDQQDQVVWGVSRHTADNVGRYIDAACEALGLERWTSHGVRRMCVTTAIRNGVKLAAAADMFGHSVAVMLDIYNALQDEDRIEAGEAAALGVPVEDADVLSLHRSLHRSRGNRDGH
ncbi:MAG TPA: tyrosine-type recombinase/integrase [Baekduia sp.]|nr:tyrosine-type recombinase/integrase [Baekduia sp.]